MSRLNQNNTVSLEQLVMSASSKIIGAERKTKQIAEPAEKLIDSVFAKLSILFPVNKPKESELGYFKAEWVKTLAENGVSTVAQVQAGLSRARKDCGDRQFWPSPLQFAKWCKLSAVDAGLPSDENAFREAIKNYHRSANHAWSHEIVFQAMKETGSWLFSHGKEKEVREVFLRNYSVLVKRVCEGEQLDIAIPKALPESVSVPTPAEQAKANILELRQRFNLGGAA